MYKVLVLFLLILSYCHLSNISSSDFPDHLFPSGGSESVDTSAKMDYYTITGNYLHYIINVYHEHGIDKIVVTGSTPEIETTEVVEGGATTKQFNGSTTLYYYGDYDENTPMYNIYVTIYPTTGDTVDFTFTINAKITETEPTIPSTDTSAYIEFDTYTGGSTPYRYDSVASKYTVLYPIKIKSSLYTDYNFKNNDFQFYWGSGSDSGAYGLYDSQTNRISDDKLSIDEDQSGKTFYLEINGDTDSEKTLTTRLKFVDDDTVFTSITSDTIPTTVPYIQVVDLPDTSSGGFVYYPVEISQDVRAKYNSNDSKLSFCSDSMTIYVSDYVGVPSLQYSINKLNNSGSTTLYLALEYDSTYNISMVVAGVGGDTQLGTVSITTPTPR